MSSFNKVILVGRLGADPEVRDLSGGQQITCRVRLATSERFKDRSGQQQERTDWHTAKFWGRQAEICQQYLRKGSLVLLEGSLRADAYTTNAGEKRTDIHINVRSFQMLGGRDDQRRAPDSYANDRPSDTPSNDRMPQQQSGSTYTGGSSSPSGDFSDDLPF